MTAVVVRQIGRRVLCSAGSYIIIAIGKSVLSYPLVVGCERNQSACCLLTNQLQSCSGFVAVVGTFACSLVSLESILSVIESRKRISSQSFSLAIMTQLCHTPEMVANAHLHICTLILQRTLGVNSDKSSLGILPVERTLRAT